MPNFIWKMCPLKLPRHRKSHQQINLVCQIAHFSSVRLKLQQRQSLCFCVIFVATEMDKMKLDDADNGFDNIGETEACKKLNELKQEPEEKSTVPQVFKKVY